MAITATVQRSTTLNGPWTTVFEGANSPPVQDLTARSGIAYIYRVRKADTISNLSSNWVYGSITTDIPTESSLIFSTDARLALPIETSFIFSTNARLSSGVLFKTNARLFTDSLLPAITGERPIIVEDGNPIDITFSATNSPTSWAATLADGSAVSTVNISFDAGQFTGSPDIGQHKIIITATNAAGTSREFHFLVVCYASLVTLNATWYAANGPAPYVLDGVNTAYQASENHTVDETLFDIQADGVTLDVNSFDLTYNNKARYIVDNEDFDNWTGSPDDWVVSGPGSVAQVAKASSFVEPKRLCEGSFVVRVINSNETQTSCTISTGSPAIITSVSHGLITGDAIILDGMNVTVDSQVGSRMVDGGHVITKINDDSFSVPVNVTAVSDGNGFYVRATLLESNAITIPNQDRLYAATVFTTNDPGSFDDYDASIKIVDASTGDQLEEIGVLDQWGSFENSIWPNQRNFSPTAIGRSKTRTSVKIQIFIASRTETSQIDVCRVRFSHAYDCGVLNHFQLGTLPHAFNFDTTGWPNGVEQDRTTIIDTVGGGKIAQGQNRGYRSWPFMIRKSGDGVALNYIDFEQNGDDPGGPLDHSTLGQPANVGECIVANCNFTQTYVDSNITRRFSQLPYFSAGKNKGDVFFINNTITDNPGPVWISSTSDSSLYAITIRNNNVFPTNCTVNGYQWFATSNNIFEYNTIDATSGGAERNGRGLYIAAGQNQTVDGVTCRHNTVICREVNGREGGSATRALRIRNQENGGSTNGTLLNIVVTDNNFETYCLDSDYKNTLHSTRISVRYNANGMDSTNFEYKRNTHKAINDQGSGEATGIEIGRWDSSVANPDMEDNVFISNHRGIKLHGTDDTAQTIEGLNFGTTTIEKDATAGAPGAHFSYVFGYSGSSVTDNCDIGPVAYAGGASTDIDNIGGTHDVTIT